MLNLKNEETLVVTQEDISDYEIALSDGFPEVSEDLNKKLWGLYEEDKLNEIIVVEDDFGEDVLVEFEDQYYWMGRNCGFISCLSEDFVERLWKHLTE